jgi:hypothetical protein
MNAGMDSIAITTMHQAQDFKQYGNVIRFIENYENLEIN